LQAISTKIELVKGGKVIPEDTGDQGGGQN
jgi:hypothetical protein